MKSDPQVIFQINRHLAERIARNYSNIPGAGMEDVTSTAYDALYRAAYAYDPDKGSFEPFAGTAIRNALNSLYRVEVRHAQRFIDETSLADAADENADSFLQSRPDLTQDIIQNVRAQEARDVLCRHLPTLTDRAQQVLDLYSLGHSYEEIGQQLGVSKQAAHKMAVNAFEQLRLHLANEGIHGVEGGMLAASIRNPTAKSQPETHFQAQESWSFWGWLRSLFR
ncbi:sigma-70 family RNA polymerase sigma factor [Prosthecobacter sp.]|uniref:sigma-70 family RNA polymerase sigma factor n=1 Tax=Prosthecobacter sp. TaxID=1965333 RepID=UPI0037C5CE79